MSVPSILIVEDEYVVARDLANRLAEIGYAVLGPVTEGRAALALMETSLPDLVLMDIRLAGESDGIATAIEMRRRQDIPVVFLTAFADEDTLQRAKQAEPHGYLSKPCEDRALRSVIEMALARHLAEKRLRESDRRLDLALTAARMGVWEMNLADYRILWSPHGYRITDPPAFNGNLKDAAKLLHPDDAASALAGLEKAIQEQSFLAVQARMRRPDGEYRWISITARPVLNAQGKPFQVVGTLQDITERKQLEEHLRQAQKLEAIGHLAGGLAHELNNVLAATVLNLSLLQMNVTQGEGRNTLSDLEALAGRAAGIVRQLLAFSRQSPMAARALALSSTIGEFMSKLRQAIGDSYGLTLVAPAALPLVQADPDMLQQLLVNLVLNARDAMPHGGQIRIELEERELNARQAEQNRDARAGRFVCLAVSDSGCGMDASTLARLFEPFFTTKEIGRGMGMGLASVYGIVCQHQGWTEVESQVGKGSTFRVFLPAMVAPTPSRQAMESTAVAGGGETILVVEDEAPLLKVISTVLRRQGYQVLEAQNSDEAISLWQKQKSRINLLYADIALPGGMSGIELAQRLRLDRPELSIVLSSGHQSGLKGLGELAEHAIYLAKPAGPEQMAKTIREALDRKLAAARA